MTIRLSSGARNGLILASGFCGLFNRGYAEVRSGTQPVSADAASTGTLLGVISANSLALTKETRATGTVTLTGGASGSVNDVTVGGLSIIPDGAIPFNTSLNQTASDLCDAINRNGLMEATVSGAVVTIKPRYGVGATMNGEVVTATLTTITASYANIGSGVSPVNGLILGLDAVGRIAKVASQVWSFNGIAPGTAGWFRLFSSDTADNGSAISGAPYYPRIDGSCGVGSGDMSLSSLAVETGSPHTIDRFRFTMPANA